MPRCRAQLRLSIVVTLPMVASVAGTARRAHAAALKEKLDAANTAQVVARGFERGLLPLRVTAVGG
jgi:hypothetical protein